jgi:hypothetical protein
MRCPIKNKDWNAIVEAYGEDMAYKVYYKNGMETPTLEVANDIIVRENLQTSKPMIKPGIEELFDTNSELANQVYETLVPKGYTRLYRAENEKGVDSSAPSWLLEQPEVKTQQEAEGRWFYKSYEEAKYHADKFGSSGITYIDVLTDEVESFNAKDNKFGGGYAKDGKEYFVSKELASTKKSFEQQKQQAISLYSQYLEQNSNGNVEQFKSWVKEFNRNNKKLNSNIQLFNQNQSNNFDSSKLKDDDLALMLFNQALGLNLTSISELTWDNIKNNIFFEKEDGSLGVKNLAFTSGGFLKTSKPTINDFINQKGLFPDYKVFIGESVIYPNVFETLEENEIIKQAIFDNLFNLSGAFEQVKKELNNHSPETFIIETPQGKFTFPKRFAAGFWNISTKVELLLKENQSTYIQDYLTNKRKREEVVKDGKKIKPIITQTLTVNDTIVQNAIGLIGNPIIENAIKNNTSVKIQVFSNTEYSEDGIAGWYLPATNTIYLHESMLNPKHLSEGLPLIAHELIHSVTEQSLQFDKNFQRDVQSLLESVKNQSEIKDFYGFKNTSEFLSEAFSSEEFRELLRNTQFSNTEKLSVWQKFINAVLKLFNKSTKYTEKSNIKDAEQVLNNIIKQHSYKIGYVKSTISDKLNSNNSLSDFISQKSQEKLNAIQEIFNQNPELSKIGDVFSYASYLDTIFPDSKVKDIVYHGVTKDRKAYDNILKNGFDFTSSRNWDSKKSKFLEDDNTGMFFSDKATAQSYGMDLTYFINDKGEYEEIFYDNTIPAILDIQYLDTTKATSSGSAARFYRENKDKFKIGMYGIEGGSEGEHFNYVVFEPSQIHILGSKQDIQGFKEFVDTNNISDVSIDTMLKDPKFAEFFEHTRSTDRVTSDREIIDYYLRCKK